MAEYFGADLVGIVRLPSKESSSSPSTGEERGEGDERYPFAVICAVRADYDPREAPGIGGQAPVQNGLFISFVLSAWIRELGFRATAAPDPDAEKLAAAAGLGTLNEKGRLVTPQFGANVHVANGSTDGRWSRSIIKPNVPFVHSSKRLASGKMNNWNHWNDWNQR
jgi:hypothetical protein